MTVKRIVQMVIGLALLCQVGCGSESTTIYVPYVPDDTNPMTGPLEVVSEFVLPDGVWACYNSLSVTDEGDLWLGARSETELFVYRSSDGGTTWELETTLVDANSGDPAWDTNWDGANNLVSSFAQTDDGHVFVTVAPAGVVYVLPPGGAFTILAQQPAARLLAEYYTAPIVRTVGNRVYVASDPQHNDTRLWFSDDHGASWTEVDISWPDRIQVFEIVQSGHLVVGMYNHLAIASNEGLQFLTTEIVQEESATQPRFVVAERPGEIDVLNTFGEVFSSRQSGAFASASDQLFPNCPWISGMVTEGPVYVVFTGSDDEGQYWVSRDGGISFEDYSIGGRLLNNLRRIGPRKYVGIQVRQGDWDPDVLQSRTIVRLRLNE